MELLLNNGEDLLTVVQREALDLSGLSYERAFAIDSSNLALEIDSFAFLNLADIFFTKVVKDTSSPLSGMFREESLEYTMKAFADFLYQRCGGGSQFTDRRGFISISELHSQYEISVEMVEKWCDVMEEAMYRMKSDFNEDHRQQILDYLRYQGYEIIVWAKYKKLLKKRGPLF